MAPEAQYQLRGGDVDAQYLRYPSAFHVTRRTEPGEPCENAPSTQRCKNDDVSVGGDEVAGPRGNANARKDAEHK